MKLNPQDLEKITDLTLDHYNRHAEDFWEGTRNHDVSQNIAAMLQYIQGERPFTILSILAVGQDATLRPLPNSVTSQRVWKAPRTSRPWRAPIAGAKYGNRIFSSSIYPTTISTAYSPTPRCFMSPARNCRACCENCVHV